MFTEIKNNLDNVRNKVLDNSKQKTNLNKVNETIFKNHDNNRTTVNSTNTLDNNNNPSNNKHFRNLKAKKNINLKNEEGKTINKHTSKKFADHYYHLSIGKNIDIRI